MEQFYYLSDEFLKAHFNIPELGNYVLVQYRDGDQFFVSLGLKSKRCASNTDCLSICAEEKYATPMRMKRTVSVVKFWDGQLLNPIRKKEKSWFLTKTANYVSPLPTSILKSCTKTVGAAKTFAAIFLWMIRHISSAGISMPGILTLTPNCWNQEYCIIQVIVFLSGI